MRIFERLDGDWKIEFIYSPLFELLCSLHVLTNPEHHLERLNWARDMKETMDARLYDEILYIGHNFHEWCTIMDFHRVTDTFNDLNVMAAIDALSEISTEDFICTIIGDHVSIDDVKLALRRKDSGKLDISNEQAGIFRDAEGFKRRVISCLKEYYYLHFERELRYIEPAMIRALKRHAERYESSGISDYVKALHKRIEVSDDAFYFHKYTRFEMPFKGLKNIIFMPSSFSDPHLLIGIYGSDTLHLNIRVHLSETVEEVPMDLFNTLKALGDDTRLKILKEIYKTPSSTQSLSMGLGLTEAGISKHLKILHEAGVLYKERKGNYIYYCLDRMMLDRIPMDIYQFLDGGAARKVV